MNAGVIAYGIDSGGKHARASGWGPGFLDGGSGYDLGAPPRANSLDSTALLGLSKDKEIR